MNIIFKILHVSLDKKSQVFCNSQLNSHRYYIELYYALGFNDKTVDAEFIINDFILNYKISFILPSARVNYYFPP